MGYTRTDPYWCECWEVIYKGIKQNDYWWYVSNIGRIKKVRWIKNSKNKYMIEPGSEIFLKPYLKEGRAYVKYGSCKPISLARLVAMHHRSREFYQEGKNIVFLKNSTDPFNCDIKNLILLTRKQASQITSRMTNKTKRYTIYRKYHPEEARTFIGGRAAAKFLNCSYQTFYDYVNKTVNNSVLSNWMVKVK